MTTTSHPTHHEPSVQSTQPSTFPVRISGTMRDATEVAMWVRATACLRRQHGAWTIVHEHASVPFDAETGQAVLRGEL